MRPRDRPDSEMEFVEMTSKIGRGTGKRVLAYSGSYATLKKIKLLWNFYAQFFDFREVEECILTSLEQEGEISDDQDLPEWFRTDVDRLMAFRNITKRGFVLLSTSTFDGAEENQRVEKWLFGRSIKNISNSKS